MLLISILLLLLSNAVTLRRDMSILFNRIAIIGLFYCIMLYTIISFITRTAIGLHGGVLSITGLVQIFHTFIFIVSILILVLTSFYPRKVYLSIYSLNYLILEKFTYYRTKIINKMGEHIKIIEYPLILLFVISGAVFLTSSNDLISIFLSIELQSYGLYLLSTVYRNSELSTIGGLIYFLLGGLSSCFILLGSALLYANSGTTSLEGLYIINSISDIYDNITSWYKSHYINLSLLVFSVGFLFKVSAAPFHFWSPDVYDAIPTIVTTFVAIVAKISIFVFLLELVYYTGSPDGLEASWTVGLLISSLISLLIGTIVGLTQFRIKRLFAYSTISHVGFILLALSISSIESTQAFIFYLIQYSISNLNAFIILITIGFSLYFYISNNKEYNNLLDKNNSPIQLIDQLRGYFYINPGLSISLAITIFSFAGIPPLVGFFAKQIVLSAALDNGYIFLSLIAILVSVIGAVYYLNVIKEIFFFLPKYLINSELKKLSFNGKITGRFTDRYIRSSEADLIDVEADLIDITTGFFKYDPEFRYKKCYSYRNVKFDYRDIYISSPMAITISIITLVILLFMFLFHQLLSMGAILAQVLFNTS